jgi:flagellar hook-associated protein 1 FlgK
VLVDQRDTAALKLSEVVGGKARIDSDGHMRFLLDDGSVVVDGPRAAAFEAVGDATLGGMSRIDIVDGAHRLDVTGSISSGRLGADIHFRDNITNTLVAEADQLAFDVATNLNAVHRGFAGLDGGTGRDLFVEPLTVNGAARLFAVDPTVDDDPSLLAAATVGQPVGDNSGMLALMGIQDQLLAGGGTSTFVDESVRFISNIGQDVRAAVIDQKFHEAQKNGVDALRDSIAGVSLEEELNRLSQFQHASEANMRFVRTVDQLLSRLIDFL